MKKSNIFWGILWILAAAFLIFSKLGFMQGISVFTIVLTIILGVIIIKSLRPLNIWGVVFPLAFISILYDEQLHIESLTPWTVLICALLLCIGLQLLFGSRIKKHSSKHIHIQNSKIESSDGSDGYVTQNVRFGAATKYVNSNDFKEANLSCDFGALEVYFDNAQIAGDDAVINLSASFSGVELYIPKNWRIENHMSVSLGGVDDNNSGEYVKDKTVYLYGSVSFGGIDINYI